MVVRSPHVQRHDSQLHKRARSLAERAVVPEVRVVAYPLLEVGVRGIQSHSHIPRHLEHMVPNWEVPGGDDFVAVIHVRSPRANNHAVHLYPHLLGPASKDMSAMGRTPHKPPP